MTETAPGDATDRLAAVFDLVGPLYRRSYRKVESDLADKGLTVGARAVLVMLHRQGPMTVPQMGRAQALSRQFVQRMVNEAAALDLVESVANPAHKRSSLIRLTDRGRTAIEAVLARERAALHELGADLHDSEVDACIRVLARLVRGLDDVDVE
jgi:DNA-binding MarR family transcriptional regulator